MLPFLERLGHDVPPWDFRVEGVTEISADVHKYGYCPKGASAILHRDAGLVRPPGVPLRQLGLGPLRLARRSPGARPAGPIATAWAALTYLGEAGYVEIMRDLMKTAAEVRGGDRGDRRHRGRRRPDRPGAGVRSPTPIDLYAVGDVMDDKGWNLNRNTDPRGLHLMLSPAHGAVAGQLIADFRDAVANHGESRGVEARYS